MWALMLSRHANRAAKRKVMLGVAHRQRQALNNRAENFTSRGDNQSGSRGAGIRSWPHTLGQMGRISRRRDVALDAADGTTSRSLCRSPRSRPKVAERAGFTTLQKIAGLPPGARPRAAGADGAISATQAGRVVAMRPRYAASPGVERMRSTLVSNRRENHGISMLALRLPQNCMAYITLGHGGVLKSDRRRNLTLQVIASIFCPPHNPACHAAIS
jgi:hypothetical protein